MSKLIFSLMKQKLKVLEESENNITGIGEYDLT